VFYTYAHYTPEGRLFYIGKGQGGRAHSFNKRNKQWNQVVEKHGKPDVQVLANWDTEEEALDHERLLISCFRDLGHKLCNLSDGGYGNAGYKLSTEAKQKISLSLVGNKRSVGVVQAIEQREKNSKKQIGNSRALGHRHTKEYKEKISLLLKGNKNACGKNCKWVGTHQKTKNTIVFLSTTELNKAGFQHSNVIKCINGLRKSHKGYTWAKEPWGNK
jgi:hypothetical protein